ncbi:MAG: hypothetical protein CM15mP11_10090 [Gammaproteobacteria bacterium]|nr:MAG: hypothetical protein CM15mP11_10090 [Gammaproteobacteria bacterium]
MGIMAPPSSGYTDSHEMGHFLGDIPAFIYFSFVSRIYSQKGTTSKRIILTKMKRLFLTSLVFVLTISADEQLISTDELLDGLHQDAHQGNFQAYFARYTKKCSIFRDR